MGVYNIYIKRVFIGKQNNISHCILFDEFNDMFRIDFVEDFHFIIPRNPVTLSPVFGSSIGVDSTATATFACLWVPFTLFRLFFTCLLVATSTKQSSNSIMSFNVYRESLLPFITRNLCITLKAVRTWTGLSVFSI